MPDVSQKQRPWLLAIDASTEQTGLALFDGSSAAELSWLSGRNQTRTIFTELMRLAELAGCSLQADLGAVAVATGPGMFNGLRVGASIAKGLALASGIDLIGVSTLKIAAHPFGPSGRPVIVVAAAGRRRLLWQAFTPATLAPAGPAMNGTIDELETALRGMDTPAIVTGELDSDQWERLQNLPFVVPAPAPAHLRRASSLAAIGWRRWLAGAVDDPATLEPVYLHANATLV